MNDFTMADKLKWTASELRHRRNLYPDMIKKNQITQKAAKQDLAILEAIAEDYRENTNQGKEAIS